MATPKRTIKQNHLGTHFIAEFFGCENINDLKFVRQALVEAADRCGATILHTKLHKFSPQGITGYLLLKESHISIHTWPEYGYAAVDVFTCGLMKPEDAIRHLEEVFGVKESQVRKLIRGRENR